MTVLMWRRSVLEYARRPLNLVLLVAVPVIFVTLSAGALADFADILGGLADLGTVEAATAGWAAAVLAGVAAFFHVSGSRDADRRLALAGAGPARVVAARLASSLTLALFAASGGLIALALRTGIADVPRVVGATVLFAVIYVGLGTLVGALVRNETNGSLIVVFAWMFDVFFGPAMGRSGGITVLFPLHFPTQVVTDVASGHAGPLGDLGLALAWGLGALVLAAIVLTRSTRASSAPATRLPASLSRIATALRYGFRDYRRNTVLWVLLIGLPVVFITLSIATTPADPAPVRLVESGRSSLQILSMDDLHGAIMIPITVGFLAGLAGLFVVLGSTDGDRRLALCGYRPRELLAARAGVIGFAALLATAVALGVTAFSFTPERWLTFALANILVALTYAGMGVIAGVLAGRLGGLYLMLLLPFVDIGLAQNAMFDAAPPAWGRLLPGHGAMRVLLDGAFTTSFDQTGALLLALAWLAAITTASFAVFHRLASPRTT
jgi:hypothetical protein